MVSKPFAYDSLRIVLQHIEANKRFQLASRIPSIRQTEKAVPLKINTIKLDDNNHFVVNQVEYRVSLYFEIYVPEGVHYQNMYGHFEDDIDEFGFVKRSGRRTVLPGDLLIGRPGLDVEDDRDDETQMLELENELKEEEGCLLKFQSAILQLAYSEPDEENKNKINGEHLNLLNDRLDPLQFVAENKTHPCGIKLLKESLTPFYRRRDNIPLPYTPLIQISINGKGIDQVHRLPYNMKVYEAQTRLAFIIFGNRPCAIKTGSLEQKFCEIFRLPVGVKFYIQELQINGNITKIYESIKPIIEETSFPLAVLQTFQNHEGHQNYDHEVVKTAQKLVIGESKRSVRRVNWFNLFTSLNNKIVHKILDDKFFSEDDYVRCLTVPMKVDSQGRMIQISYGTNDYELASLKLKIEVVPTNLA
ncbi:hypothetical protein GCK72_007722 [Caenorhabditis remanei]|uniref:Uncharacterized protein n=1 Tax=Caenorhabditis remanei TaxID=31234 RepID=A0A6A5HN28_CAERE|nr:hypothetical protein GCK72_007722 [Caenorhabditis remanei]KAF1767763.1 hypothetical protein GCK72_007722 [Caenorhabditis remanei]